MAAGCGAPESPVEAVSARLRTEEGFRSKPYEDSRGVLTIGYGTNIAEGITVAEAEYLLRSRLESTEADLARRWAFYESKPVAVRTALLDAAYQLGVDGLLGFRKMMAHIAKGEYAEAITEARASAWNRETPHRVDALVEVLQSQE